MMTRWTDVLDRMSADGGREAAMVALGNRGAAMQLAQAPRSALTLQHLPPARAAMKKATRGWPFVRATQTAQRLLSRTMYHSLPIFCHDSALRILSA